MTTKKRKIKQTSLNVKFVFRFLAKENHVRHRFLYFHSIT